MKSVKPDNEDFAGGLPGPQVPGDRGYKQHSGSSFDGIPGDETDDDLPALKPLNVTFGRKETLMKDEALDDLSDPGFPLLIPPSVTYPHKASLRRRPAGQRIFAFVAEALSAAAIIIILLTLFRKGPDTTPYKVVPALAEASVESAGEKQITETPVTGVTDDLHKPSVRQTVRQTFASPGETVMIITGDDTESLVSPPDTSAAEAVETVRVQAYLAEFHPSMAIPGISLNADPALLSFSGELPSPEDPDLRSNVERFAARFFHEKIMNDKESGDTPVKAVDLAEAGIMGINKLLGTAMVFVRNTNENGEMVSVYFGSQALKINAPVKRN